MTLSISNPLENHDVIRVTICWIFDAESDLSFQENVCSGSRINQKGSRARDLVNTHFLLRVVFAIPTLGQRGCGRTLGGIRVFVGLFVVSSTNHRKVSHLEGVGLLTATLQRASHTITHVEVARRHVRRQVQLTTKRNRQRSHLLTSAMHICLNSWYR